jgi:tetratricopeptide (TPR) repeat protein
MALQEPSPPTLPPMTMQSPRRLYAPASPRRLQPIVPPQTPYGKALVHEAELLSMSHRPHRPPIVAVDALPAPSPRVLCVQAGHAMVLQHKYAAAEPAYRDALARKEAALGPNNASTLSSVVSLADILALQGRHEEAMPMLQRALTAYDASPHSVTHRHTRPVAARLSCCLSQAGRADDATDLERRFPPPSPPPPVKKRRRKAPAPAVPSWGGDAPTEGALAYAALLLEISDDGRVTLGIGL